MTAPKDTLRPAVRRALTWLLALVVGLALVALAVSRTTIGEAAWDRLAGADAALALGAAALCTTSFLWNGLRWRALLPPGHRPGPAFMAGLVASATTLNLALPGPVGELAAAALAERRCGVPATLALAAGLTARLVGLATATALAGATLAAGDLPVPDRWRTGLRVAGAALVGGGCLLLVVSTSPAWLHRLADLLLRPMERWARLEGSVRVARRLAHELADSVSLVVRGGPGRWVGCVGWAFVGHLAVPGGIALAAHAMHLRPAPVGVLFTYCAATALSPVLFAVPGTQVAWVALFAALLVATAQVAPADAAALVAFVQAQQLLAVALGAAVLTVWVPRRAPHP